MIVARRGFLACLLLALASSARAEVMSLEFGGVITRAGSASGAAAGERFSGTVTYGTDLNTSIGASNFTQYSSWNSNTPVVLSLRLGTAPARNAQGGLALSLSQGAPSDAPGEPPSEVRYWVSTGTLNDLVALDFRNASLALFPGGPSAIPAPTSLSLSDFPDASFLMGDIVQGTDRGPIPFDPASNDVEGVIDSVSLVTLPPGDPGPIPPPPPIIPPGDPIPTPEPTACLAMIALAGFLARRSRRRQRTQ